MTPSDDHALISLAKSGDQSAWCDLLQRHEGAMKRLVAKGVGRGYDENDVWSYVHEAFVRCVNGYEPDCGVKFISYFWRSAENRLNHAYRSGPIYLPPVAHLTDRRAASLAKVWISFDAAIGRDGFSLHRLIASDPVERLSDEDCRRLSRAIGFLDRRMRQVVEGRLEGRTMRQIGESLGLSKEHTQEIFRAACEQLRRVLNRRYVPEPTRQP